MCISEVGWNAPNYYSEFFFDVSYFLPKDKISQLHDLAKCNAKLTISGHDSSKQRTKSLLITSSYISSVFIYLHKKVLLRERKRHTTRCVASTPYVVLTGYPPGRVLPGRVPPSRVPPGQDTPPAGYPPAGYPPGRVPPGQGTPQPGYPPGRVPPARVPPWQGTPSQGTPPGRGPPGRVPPQQGTPLQQCSGFIFTDIWESAIVFSENFTSDTLHMLYARFLTPQDDSQFGKEIWFGLRP